MSIAVVIAIAIMGSAGEPHILNFKDVSHSTIALAVTATADSDEDSIGSAYDEAQMAEEVQEDYIRRKRDCNLNCNSAQNGAPTFCNFICNRMIRQVAIGNAVSTGGGVAIANAVSRGKREELTGKLGRGRNWGMLLLVTGLSA